MTDRDKAAFVWGLVSGYRQAGWPAMDPNTIDRWRAVGFWAKQMLGEGVFSPLYAMAVIEAADEQIALTT